MVQVWVSRFCVETLFNGMVEFLVKFWLMGKWWVLGNCDRTNAWLPTYPLDRRIRSPRSSLMTIVLFALIFSQISLSSFQPSRLSHFSFFFFFFSDSPFAQIALSGFQPNSFCFFFLSQTQEGKQHNLQLLQMWYFFNWSMLVSSVKWFASKCINLTTPQSIFA